MTGPMAGSGLPLGGLGLSVDDYVDFVGKEYLGDYIRAGGSSVKLVVPGADTAGRRWHAGLAAAAAAEGYLYATVDASRVRVHLMDQVFAAVSREADWPDLARRAVQQAYGNFVERPVSRERLAVADVARERDDDPGELARSVRRQLERDLLRDASLARDFRLALLRLCQAELGTGEVTEEERTAVLAWLRVEPVALRQLRSAAIYGRVARHNARSLLASMSSWLPRVGGTGLVLDLDLGRLAVSRRPPAEQRDGVYYSRAAVLDAYELLRQLVDATDSLRGVFVAATIPPELVTDDSRGLPAYAALQLRVVDEVRDRCRANPYASLVRLETRLEAVR